MTYVGYLNLSPDCVVCSIQWSFFPFLALFCRQIGALVGGYAFGPIAHVSSGDVGPHLEMFSHNNFLTTIFIFFFSLSTLYNDCGVSVCDISIFWTNLTLYNCCPDQLSARACARVSHRIVYFVRCLLYRHSPGYCDQVGIGMRFSSMFSRFWWATGVPMMILSQAVTM